ncbi:hypothetical protein HK102_007841 [Quaeritorhiza haematococci]|nr:hypothetical protein HK102_007841 [Quaeritorhiza haematococci]
MSPVAVTEAQTTAKDLKSTTLPDNPSSFMDVDSDDEPIQDAPIPETESDEEEHEVGKDLNLTADGGVVKRVLEKGVGWRKPKKGDEVKVLYVGRLKTEEGEGDIFDQNLDREKPFTFKLGKGQVIKGWDTGVATMKKYERALLTLSPDYAYGSSGAGEKIPPNSTLQFEVTLLDWVSANVHQLSDDGEVYLTMTKVDDGAWLVPKENWDVVVNYTARLAKSHTVLEKRESFLFTIDDTSPTIPPFFSQALRKFHKGDTGTIHIPAARIFTTNPETDPEIQHLVDIIRAKVPTVFENPSEQEDVEFDIELVKWHEVESFEDGHVVKKILEEGNGWERPQDGWKVKVLGVGKAVPSGVSVFDATTIEQDGAADEQAQHGVEFVLGTGDLPEALDVALGQMKKGEKAEVRAPLDWCYGTSKLQEKGIMLEDSSKEVDGESAAVKKELVFEVMLVDFVEGKQSWDMSKEEKMEDAQKCRELGNALFKDGKARWAVRKYEKAVKYFQYDTDLSADQKETLNTTILLPCHLNLAACYSKPSLHDPSKILEHANQALGINKNSVKALYRRAQALSLRQEYEDAEKDLKRAIELQPKEPSLRVLLREVREKMKGLEEKEKKLFKKMFGGL